MTTQTSRLVIEIDSRNAERNARNVANELQNIERNGDHASRSMDSMSVATRSLVGYMGGLVTIGAAISKMDAYTGLQNRLKLVTDSQAELNTAMSDTFGIAQKTASSWDSVAMVYQRFADNADRLNITMAQTSALTETVSKAISVSGGSAASTEAALMQFGQALASGVLRGEEFNSIAEQAPGLLKAIAFGLNTNVGSLRAMAQDGKITGDVLVDALGKAKPYIDDLFNKTDFTISQSFTKLSNEVTKFVGEAGKGSGAASALSDSIGFLAKNLSTIADIAIVGGVAMLTKTILAQTVAIQGSITASVARRSTLLAELAVQAAASTAEVARTGAIAQFTAMQLVDAKATAARMTGIQRLAYVQATVIPLEAKATQMTAAHSTATAADTVVQNANNAARSRGAMLLRMIGGPIGAITLGVAGLAAGYMYLKNRTAEANAKLEEQGKVAEKTNEELTKLSGNDKKNAVSDLTAAFNAQNAELSKSKEAVDAVLFAIRASSVENEKARKVTEDAKNGVISYNQAIELLNKMDISPELYEMLKKTALQYDENSNKAGNSQRVLKIFGIEVKLAGNAAQNAVDGLDSNSNAMRNNADATNAAANAQSKYISNLQKGAAQTIMTNKLIAKGWDIERAKMASQAAFDNGGKVSAKDIQIIDMNIVANKKLQASEDTIANAKRGSAKASKDALSQQKKDNKEAERLDKERYDLRESIYYNGADRIRKIEKDLQNEIADIQKASFSPKDTAGYIQNAQNRADLEKKLYIAQLTEDVSAWRLSEERKLELKKNINDLTIQLNGDMNDDFKKQALQSSEDQYQHELGLIQLAKEQRIFQMQQGLISANAQSERYWELERQRIMLNVQDLAQRNRELAIANALQAEEKRTNLNTAVQQWGGINAEMTGTTDQFNLEKERFDRLDASQALFDAELAMAGENYALKEQAYQAYVDRMIAIENAYQVSSVQLQLGYGEQMASSMSTMMGAIFGEKSKAYAAAFAVEKAFAVAQAALAMGQNIAQASKMGFPYNIPMIAGAMAQGAQIASIISSVAQPTGYADGGFTGAGGKFDPAGIVHKGEVVWSQEDIKRWGGVNVVEAMRTSQPPKGYSDGGLVTPQDTYRVGMGTVDAINRGADVQAERQAQASAKAQSANPQPIENNLRVIMVKDEDEAKDWLYNAEGEKAFLYHLKRNRSKI